MEVMYITYAQAQRLLPVMKHIVKTHQWREVRNSASRIIPELEAVRGDISYEPLRGRQVFLKSENDRDFLRDAIEALG